MAARIPRCPVTRLTLPECSCRACFEQQVLEHAPDHVRAGLVASWRVSAERLAAPETRGPQPG